jgi:hypothetical protein
MAGKSTTYVADQVAKVMEQDKGGRQVGLRNRFAEVAKKLGAEPALAWLLRHVEITMRFRSMFERKSWAVGDSEGTGVGEADEMCELAFVRGHDSAPLFSKLMGTTVEISEGAERQHKISNEMIAGLPSFADLQSEINDALDGIDEIVWYNGEYDLRVKDQTSFAQGIDSPEWPTHVEIMPEVGEWIGSWNPQRRSWRWAKLEGGHRAAGDCTYLIRYMRVMSQSDVGYARELAANNGASDELIARFDELIGGADG